MNYLLVLPKKLGKIEFSDVFPIGLAYVSASMKKNGHKVFTSNLEYMEGDTYSILLKLLIDNEIDVICTGGLSRDYSKIKEVFDIVRTINPKLITIVGGGIITSDPEVAMTVINADIGILGEGELTMCELAFALDNDLPYSNIPGIILKNNDNTFSLTGKRKDIANIDSIPFPDFDGFGYSTWVKSSGYGVLYTDRSCPFRCTFCFHPTGSKYRQRSLDSIFSELDYQIEHYGIRTLALTGELFALTQKRVEDFCNRIKSYNIIWSCCLRVTDLNLDLLKLMKESGCFNLVLGLESADNSILKSMKKNIKVEHISRALELSYQADLMIEGSFIFGDINETVESAETTLQYWKNHNDMHYLNVAMITVFPGSYLYKYACDNNLIKDKVAFLQNGCPTVNVSKLSSDEYLNLQAKLYELRFHPHVPARDFEIKSITDEGVCEVVFYCRKCNKPSQTNSWFWFGKEMKCSSCGLINFIDPFLKAKHDAEFFTNSINSAEAIVLWGAGGVAYKLINKYPSLSSERFVLVDNNSSIEGFSFLGKTIHSPNILMQKKFKSVIISALSKKNEIYTCLRNEYNFREEIYIPNFILAQNEIIPNLELINSV